MENSDKREPVWILGVKVTSEEYPNVYGEAIKSPIQFERGIQLMLACDGFYKWNPEYAEHALWVLEKAMWHESNEAHSVEPDEPVELMGISVSQENYPNLYYIATTTHPKHAEELVEMVLNKFGGKDLPYATSEQSRQGFLERAFRWVDATLEKSNIQAYAEKSELDASWEQTEQDDELVVIFGVKITPESYSELYEWGKANPESLEEAVRYNLNRWYGGDENAAEIAMVMLNEDLLHDRLARE